eukprot:2751028-Prymnesium_polylepis.1
MDATPRDHTSASASASAPASASTSARHMTPRVTTFCPRSARFVAAGRRLALRARSCQERQTPRRRFRHPPRRHAAGRSTHHAVIPFATLLAATLQV